MDLLAAQVRPSQLYPRQNRMQNVNVGTPEVGIEFTGQIILPQEFELYILSGYVLKVVE